MPPKKAAVENMHPRAISKREAQAKQAASAQAAKAHAEQEAQWAGTGPSKAELRQQEKMQKSQEQQQKKELKKMVSAEDEALMSTVKLVKSAKTNLRDLGEYKGATKVTQFELQQRKDKEEEASRAQLELENKKKEKIFNTDHLAFENTNHERRNQKIADESQYGTGNVVSAEDVDTAIKGMSLLTISGSDIKQNDKWPEKRRKQAYKQFEERRMRELRLDYPDLKLSQLKEKCFKEFQTSPENPVNQPK